MTDFFQHPRTGFDPAPRQDDPLPPRGRNRFGPPARLRERPISSDPSESTSQQHGPVSLVCTRLFRFLIAFD
jgi:hypothetical protein